MSINESKSVVYVAYSLQNRRVEKFRKGKTEKF